MPKKKGLSYFLKLGYPILITQDEDNGEFYYEAEIPDLPGCGAYGKDKKEALERLEEAKKLWMTSRMKRNLPIPEPVSIDDFRGKCLLRITPRLHMQLTQGAKRENSSLNQFIRKNLETAITLDSILKKIEDLSQEVKQLSEKASRVPEANILGWKEQPLQPVDKPIIATGTATFSGWPNVGCASNVLVGYGGVGAYGVDIWSDVGSIFLAHRTCEKKKNIDLIDPSTYQEV